MTLTVAELTDSEILQLRLALQLACGRGKMPLTRKRRLWFCFLFNVFNVEANLRGLPQPPAKTHMGDLAAPTRAL